MRLRTRLITIMLATLVPTLVVVGGLAASQQVSAERRLRAEQSRRLELRGQTIAQMLEHSVRVLEALALSSAVAEGRWAETHERLHGVAELGGTDRLLAVADTSGQIRASTMPPPSRDVGSEEWFQRVLADRRPAIGTYSRGPLTGEPSLPVAAPVFAADGSVVAVAFMELPLRLIQENLAGVSPPDGTTLLLLDRDGAPLAHLPGPAGSGSRTRVDPDVMRAALSGRESADLMDTDGVRRHFRFAALRVDPKSPLHLALGTDDSVVLEPVRTQLVFGVAVLGLTWAIAALAGYWGLARWVIRPIERMNDVTLRLSEGDLDARVGQLPPVREFERLGEGLDSMADSLQRILEAQRTRRRRIEAIHGVMEAAVSSLGLEATARSMLEYLVQRHGFELTNVWLIRGSQLDLIASMGYPDAYRERISPMPMSAPYDLVKVFKSGKLIAHPDMSRANPAVVQLYEDLGLKLGAYIALPLMSRGRTIGVLVFGWHDPHPMNAYDIDFYASIGSEVGVVLDNARMYENERSVSDRLQEALLSMPESLPGVEFAYRYHSAAEQARVGGDFYDLFEIAPDKVGITVGDVAGKGLDAAVLTSLVKNTVRAHASDRATPAKVMRQTNELVFDSTPAESFVTVFFAVLDRADGQLLYANAGHTTGALVHEGGSIERLGVTGPILGAFRDAVFQQGAVRMSVGDLLFLYTDGLTEARAGRELFGEARLFDLLARLGAGQQPARVVEGVIAEAVSFAGGTLRDDLALLAICRASEQPLRHEAERQGGQGRGETAPVSLD